MNEKAISPPRQRMLDDMNMRRFINKNILTSPLFLLRSS